ncbi:MAG: RluA family pseudouridine synthase [Alphaproteobacteria bacterium]|nr:RluA family pseudouridine synthase [Rhodospirillales bacterium]MCW9045950.1 RluA family pseudouridine synthase [Alphaproteobacteria bacterium]
MSGVSLVKVTADEAGIRLDRWFKRHHETLTHGGLEKLLRKGQVRVDGKKAKSNTRLEEGQEIRVPPFKVTEHSQQKKQQAKIYVSEEEAEELRNRVLYKDDHVLVINKPVGLAVQGGSKTTKHLDAMLDVLQFDALERPRLVHRLDKDTSGVLVLARTVRAAGELAKLFKTKEVRKIYWAAVVGTPRPPKGQISAPLNKVGGAGGEKVVYDEENGKRALTYYQVIENAAKIASWLVMEPMTGRTHQLRVHCQLMNTPIVGDGKYGGAESFALGDSVQSKMHLHARGIKFRSPTGKQVEVFAPLAEHMLQTWKFLEFDAGNPEASDFSVFVD